MSSKLPKYSDPPVVETVLSIQFLPLDGYTSAHAGSYWSECLGPKWNDVHEIRRLDDVQETFGKDRVFLLPGLRVRPPASQTNRIQFRRGAKMVQVQDSRFVYNWMRQNRSSQYPSFAKILPAFSRRWSEFKGFLSSKGLPEPAVNQWEVTYVNLFKRGDLWLEFSDLPNIFRGLCIPASDIESQALDTYRSEWHYELGDAAGRLRVTLAHGQTQHPEDKQEGFSLKLTARGPIEKEEDLPRLLDLGHEAIVLTFTSLTTETAHKHWGRTQ